MIKMIYITNSEDNFAFKYHRNVMNKLIPYMGTNVSFRNTVFFYIKLVNFSKNADGCLIPIKLLCKKLNKSNRTIRRYAKKLNNDKFIYLPHYGHTPLFIVNMNYNKLSSCKINFIYK